VRLRYIERERERERDRKRERVVKSKGEKETSIFFE
jgi:hypothetical protein